MISRNLEISLNIAVQVAQKKGHEYVGVEHILYALLDNPEAKRAFLACGGSITQTKLDIEQYFDKKLRTNVLARGANPQPTLAFQRVLQVAAQQVVSAGKEKIFGDTVLAAMFSEKESFAVYFLEKQQISRFDIINFIAHGLVKEGVDPDLLEDDSSDEAEDRPRLHGNSHDQDKEAETEGKQRRKNDPLSLYTVDLCAKARSGRIDPLIGRDNEVARAIQILCRRRKNNPLLVGDSGVGKTAIAEGLALKIVEGAVPEFLSSARIYALEMGTLLAGTKFRGDFEQRLKGLIKQLKRQERAILFIDEIHTIMGAGAVSGGTLDASNILKPFLSSGEIRCIGSTTYKEYRQHIENDHALTRRFQRISVEEPSLSDTVKILKGLKGSYERFHGVRYTLEALKGAVELSHIHLKDRKLPDKAIDVIDEAGAAWVVEHRGKSKGARNLIGLNEVKATIAKITRIPPERLSSSDRSHLRNLKASLQEVVFGQDKAVEALEQAICMARSGLAKEDKPIGSFLFSGPTGVGKTELAKQLATIMGIAFVRFDMSEYMERHAVSRLIGAPPGYVGYDEGGLLTDAIHQNPYCVLLLDEIEKAHPDVHNILLQVMDHGSLTDSNGRKANFHNVILIMTTNVGALELTKGSIGFSGFSPTGLTPQAEESKEKGAIRQAFTPEFRNRLDGIISFNPLPEKVMLQIVEKFLREVEAKLRAKRITWTVSDAAKKFLATKGFDPAYGARPLARVIEEHVKKPLAQQLLFGLLQKGGQVSLDQATQGDSLSFDFKAAMKPQREEEASEVS